MKKRLVSLLTIIALSVSMLVGCGGASDTTGDSGNISQNTTDTAKKTASEESGGDISDKKVGVCIYQFSDNFMTLFKDELKSYLVNKGFSEDNILIVDGQNDQSKQNKQIQDFINDGVDVLIVNAVNTSDAASITDMAVGANVPLVYINREPDADEEQRWQDNKWNVCYVGCDARQSGTYQGEIIADLGKSTVDLNGDGTIQYIMIEGDPENVDAKYRTDYSIKALEDAGWNVSCMADEVGNWEMGQAEQLVADALAAHPETEVVFCNNDAMAIGALKSIEAAGRTVGTDIYLVGVDALSEALQYVMDGKMTGTVFNDLFSQSHSAGDAAARYIKGSKNDHYIGCDYIKVTANNAKEIYDSIN
ncbi:MAG: galactose ABC transporter substrate-binding protein [Butyrivibrio sp.]|nr:galactose ABC transporter substrate-binding protein [Butyrivibrio sp.]